MISHYQPYQLHPIPQNKPISELSNIQPHHNNTHDDAIDIENDEREVIEVFINRMNQLEDTHNFSALQDSPQRPSSNFQYNDGTPHICERNDSQFHLTHSPLLNQRIGEDTEFRHVVAQKTREIEFQLSALQIQKFQIIDQLLTFQQQITVLFAQKSQQWQLFLDKHLQQNQKTKQSYQSQLQILQRQLSEYSEKYQQLMKQRELHGQDSSHLHKTLQQLQQSNHKLNLQLQHLQFQNSELKYQLRSNSETQDLVRQLQDEINQLNKTIDQNSQYIFDLEQRVATEGLLMAEKEANLRRDMQSQLQLEREDIQRQYQLQFQRVAGELEQHVRNQTLNQYQNTIDNIKSQHQSELENLKAQYQQMAIENINVSSQLRQLQLKYKQNSIHINQIQLTKTIQNLKSRLKDKESQVEYYKDKASKMTQLSDNKTNNILIDELNHSTSYARNSAVSPSSQRPTPQPNSRDDMINNILARIRIKQSHSILSNLNDTNLSIESVQHKKGYNNSVVKPVSPESMILEKEKDMRMKNISHKLEQLRSDIRREIGMISQ